MPGPDTHLIGLVDVVAEGAVRPRAPSLLPTTWRTAVVSAGTPCSKALESGPAQPGPPPAHGDTSSLCCSYWTSDSKLAMRQTSALPHCNYSKRVFFASCFETTTRVQCLGSKNEAGYYSLFFSLQGAAASVHH